MTTAIVHFRTLPNGSFKYIRSGQRRGFWRVLVVRDPKGSLAETSNNVIDVPFVGREGVQGVTQRSAYWIGDDYTEANIVAARLNAAQVQA